MPQGSTMQQPPDPDEGKGASADAPRLWLRAIREGWNIPDVVKRAAVNRAAQILADPTSTRREITRATQTLAILERLAIDAAVQEDKMRRLDEGMATERVELTETISDAQLGAIAQTLGKPCPKPAKTRKKPR